MELTRRKFVKLAGIAGLFGMAGSWAGCGNTAAVVPSSVAEADSLPPADKATVYFSKKIDAEHLIALYKKINSEITGRVAIKLHTGEPNGPNILPRDMVKAFQAQIPNSVIVETNTLYGGARKRLDVLPRRYPRRRRRHFFPRQPRLPPQRSRHGLSPEQLRFADCAHAL